MEYRYDLFGDNRVMQYLSSKFNLQNVKCASCVGKIQYKLSQMDGIHEVRVNLLEKTLLVEYTIKKLDKEVIDAVIGLGYGVSNAIIIPKTNIEVSISLPLILGVLMMVFGMSDAYMASRISYGVVESIITLSIIILTGRGIFISGIKSFLKLNFNMHSLIILGVGSAWLYSTWVVAITAMHHIQPLRHLYFESSIIIIGLINLGTYIEDKARSATTDAINGLAALQPNETTIVSNNQEQTLNTNLLRINYVVKIRPGELIPADGIVLEGESYVDESMLTGESMAISKKPGEKVIAGTININGMFLFTVTSVGDHTLLARIIELVRTAQMSKPNLAKLADRVASIFVPTIIMIAIIAAIIWWIYAPLPRGFYTLSVFMTILIIACPCSVGLAIPVSLMVGLSKSAQHGILIKEPDVLGVMNKLDYVLLDKTGTITEGKPQVVGFVTKYNQNCDEYLKIMKGLEKNSEHPIATAILNYHQDILNTLEITNFARINNGGIQGMVNGKKYWLGSQTWVATQVKTPNLITANNHFTQIFLADETGFLARADIFDQVKPDSAIAIDKLNQMGIKVAIVSGDTNENVTEVAHQVGIDTIYPNCKPQDKIKIVYDLQHQKNRVAFVGDGINDAPSLTQADVGIAIGGGTDVAIQSADITLISNSLIGVSQAINIAKAINRNMQQNLFGSFIYNILAVAIAAGILYPIWHILLNPIIASVAMSLSSITVIMNALRLRNI